MRLCLLLACSLLLPWPVGAQPTNVTTRVVIAGGLLGQTEGFPELPSSFDDLERARVGPVGRRVLGGAAGLRNRLEGLRHSSDRPDLLLLGGDNLPFSIGRNTQDAATFIARLESIASLMPTVVGLGTEDIRRFLLGAAREAATSGAPAAALETWLATSRVPFLASNVAISIKRDDLNVVEDGGITLEADEDSSIGWEKSLTFARPCRVQPAFTLRTGDESVAIDTKHDKTPKDDVCHSTITVTSGGRLRPGRRYDIAVHSDGRPDAHLSVHTHRALAPAKTGLTAGYPVQAPDDPRRPWVIALVDPDLTILTGNRPRRWECAGPTPGTPAARCDLIVLPPVAAAGAMLDVIAAHERNAPPFVALLSSLNDARTSEVLASAANIRIAVLPADSGLLGRASDARELDMPEQGAPAYRQPVIEESRSAGLVQGREASTTILLARPEWLAETLVEVSIEQQVSPHWRRFGSTTFSAQSVDGVALCWAPASATDHHTAYSLARTNEPFETRPSYAPGAADTPFWPNGTLRDLWVDPGELAAAAMDVMRMTAHAELALVPESLVDEDVVAWLKHVREAEERKKVARPLAWLSRFVLERALYRADAYVRVVVPGKELVTTVNKILGGNGAEKFCVAGFGETGCGTAKLDAEHLLVNGRHIDEAHRYSLALFRSLADRYELKYRDGRVHDLLDDLDARLLKSGKGQPSAGCATDFVAIETRATASGGGATSEPEGAGDGDTPSLAKDLEKLRDGPQSYVRLEPMKFDFGVTNTTLPNGANATLLGAAIEGTAPKDSQRWQVGMKGDLGVLDTRHWAVRGIGEFEYVQEEVADAVSVDKDEFTLGGRVDHKVRLGNTTARLFTGWFLEGGLKGRPQKAATARVLERITDPADASRVIQETIFKGPELAYRTEPRRFRYWAVGAELAGWSRWSWWKITQLGVQGDIGRSENELSAVRLNDDNLAIADFLKDGAEALLRKHFTDAGRNPGGDDRLTLAYQALDQRRLEISFNTEHPLWKVDGRDITIANEFRYRRYSQQPAAVAYSLRWSVRDSLSLTLPVWSRLGAVVKAEYNTVEIAAIERAFEVFRFSAGFEIPLFGKVAERGAFFR